MKATELDSILQTSKTCAKSEMRMYISRLVIEVRRFNEIAENAREVKRLSDAYGKLEIAARAFTSAHYKGLLGSTNHLDQTRLMVALDVLEVLRKQ